MKKELWLNIELRNKSESDVKALVEEVERYKQSYDDKHVHDSVEISELHAQIKDLRYQNEDLLHKLRQKDNETTNLGNDMYQWQ
jgi:hypothetical protein